MINLFIDKKYKSLLKESESSNLDEMLSWKLPNLAFPLGAVFFSWVSFFLFKNNDQITLVGFLNILLNGSLPMLALNRLGSLGVNLFKFDKEKEKQNSDKNTFNLRLKLFYYTFALVFGIAIFYIYQVINNPFILNYWTMGFQLVLLVLLIRESMLVSKYGYLLQEKLLEKTIGDDIKENALIAKKHLKNKYGR
ncbi:hypothetical protein [Flavobacterium sp.]|uniref:hypothetical protein n=1 Tax=Flavobacterium sp. TaxID=239 RepID=UPI004033485B